MSKMNPVFQFLHGKTYKINGVSGTFEHKTYQDRTGRLVQDLYHNADSNGRRTKYYQQTKRELGDDYSTCLTTSIHTYCEAARTLGYSD